MPENLKTILENIEQQPQRQDSANAQMADLAVFANKLGLYDAADLLLSVICNQHGRHTNRVEGLDNALSR